MPVDGQDWGIPDTWVHRSQFIQAVGMKGKNAYLG
jgi:hypothetical protein